MLIAQNKAVVVAPVKMETFIFFGKYNSIRISKCIMNRFYSFNMSFLDKAKGNKATHEI